MAVCRRVPLLGCQFRAYTQSCVGRSRTWKYNAVRRCTDPKTKAVFVFAARSARKRVFRCHGDQPNLLFVTAINAYLFNPPNSMHTLGGELCACLYTAFCRITHPHRKGDETRTCRMKGLRGITTTCSSR